MAKDNNRTAMAPATPPVPADPPAPAALATTETAPAKPKKEVQRRKPLSGPISHYKAECLDKALLNIEVQISQIRELRKLSSGGGSALFGTVKVLKEEADRAYLAATE